MNKPNSIFFDQLHIDIWITEELTKSERKTLTGAIGDLKRLEQWIQWLISPTPNLNKKVKVEITK